MDVYANDLRQLLVRTRQALPRVRIIIGEPFAVRGGTAITERWAPFDGYRRAARELATEFGATFVPYHDVFEAALRAAPAAYWCPDGVHPSLAGSHLMKEAWLKAFGA